VTRANHTIRAHALQLASVALVAVAVAVAVIAYRAGGQDSAISESSPSPFNGPLMPAGLRAAPFRLHDQTGHWVSLSQYRGRVVILTFMHALCTGSCPIIAQQVRGALNDLGSRARETQALAVSIEPIEDTPAMVNTFLRRQHVAGTMRYLIGPRADLPRVWKGYGIQSVAAGKRHSTFVFLIDRRGIERVGYDLSSLTPENLSHDIGVLLKE
jgi:cytochrome oxidase Cu insertion factor (SCO1/SenC/PrrC family)